jgi:signal transduction histidine kinase/DNA-binding response OmpR family regulator
LRLPKFDISLSWLKAHQPSLRWVIGGGFFLALLGVATISIQAYRNVTRMSASLQRAAEPQQVLVELRSILDLISQAENRVNTFVITQEEDNLKRLPILVDSVEAQMRFLKDSVTFQGPRTDAKVALLGLIIEDKFQVLGELIKTTDQQGRVYAFYRELSRRMDSLPPGRSSTDTTQADAAPNSVLLQAIFDSEEPGNDSLPLLPATLDPEVVTAQSIDSVGQVQDAIQKQVIALTEESNYLTARLRAMVRTLATYQRSDSQIRANEAKKQVRATTRFMVIFGTLVVILSVVLMGIIFNDMGRNQRLQQRLRQEKQRAEKLAKAKEEFLANMSHEIRTPMNAVIGFAEQLSGTALSPPQRGLLHPIRRSAQYLLALINDILDYSKLEAGQFDLDEQGFRLEELVHETFLTFSRSAREKNIGLYREVDESLPEVVIGDPLRLRQMLFNLVGNAIKFTDAGKVSVIAECLRQDGPRVVVCFKVKDTGIGIEAEKLDKLFQDFVQADSSITRRFGGTGLGLSITRKLANMHGGSVRLDSQPGQGTTAVLTLPYRIGTAADLNEKPSVPKQQLASLRGLKALVADDEPYNRLLIRTIMDKWGVTIKDVTNGKEVLAALAEEPFDFVLMDLQMPELDGIAATQEIRQQMELKLPILALTATSTQGELEQARAAGMDGHLLKPFQEQELFELLSQVLPPAAVGVKEEAAVDLPAAPSFVSPSRQQAGYDYQAAFRLANQDEAFLARMLRIFLQSTNQNLSTLETALAAQDWDTVGETAHRILPQCRHLGLKAIVDLLKPIELDAKARKRLDALPAEVADASARLREVATEVAVDLERLEAKLKGA